MSLADELQRLSDLHQRGQISDAEFAAARSALPKPAACDWQTPAAVATLPGHPPVPQPAPGSPAMTQTPADDRPAPGPLAGLRVLELGQLIAGPFTGTLLAYFGAEVIKIEPPEGDPIRQWRVVRDGTSLWWHSIGRNKKSVSVDLKTGEGRALVGRLAARCDVLVENFRPGTLEKWGLGPDVLKAANPGLVIARISGYGQDGPYAGKAGYASVCEGFGGLRYVNGVPGEPPVRPNLSIGDTLAVIHVAVRARSVLPVRKMQLSAWAPGSGSASLCCLTPRRPGR